MTGATNELLTRIGPGTLTGTLMWRYWIPVLLSSELPEPDGPRAAEDLRCHASPPRAEDYAVHRCRPLGIILSKGTDWVEETERHRVPPPTATVLRGQGDACSNT